MLIQIREYIKENRKVSLSDISIHFDIQPDAVEKILEKWIVKGVIEKQDLFSCTGLCSGCSGGCKKDEMIFYIWKEK